MTTLYRVVAPHFVAGFTVDERGYIKEAAPILKWARGGRLPRVEAYAKRRGWTVEVVRAAGLEPATAGLEGR